MSSHGAILIILPTLVFEKVFIYMHILALKCAHVGIASTCHLTHRLVTVLCRSQLCCASMKTAFWWLSLVVSGMWLFSFAFAEPLVAQHSLHIGILALMKLPRWLNICVDMGVPSFGCAVRFNPWYKNFISGLCSCEQSLCNWLIVELLSLVWVKICKWSHWTPILAYSIPDGLLCSVSWPSLLLW